MENIQNQSQKKPKRTIFFSVGLFVLIVLIVGGAIYWWGVPLMKPTTIIQTDTQSETGYLEEIRENPDHWSVFQNFSLNFQIKYPPIYPVPILYSNTYKDISGIFYPASPAPLSIPYFDYSLVNEPIFFRTVRLNNGAAEYINDRWDPFLRIERIENKDHISKPKEICEKYIGDVFVRCVSGGVPDTDNFSQVDDVKEVTLNGLSSLYIRDAGLGGASETWFVLADNYIYSILIYISDDENINTMANKMVNTFDILE